MLLRTVALTKQYERRGERFFAADSISLEVAHSDFLCITGQSGSGKSTLLNLLAGLLKPDGGEIYYDEENFTNISDDAFASLRGGKVGYIPQGNSLLYNFSVIDNVCLPWNLTRSSDIRVKARALLEKVGIAHLERESPRNLSGGEARRAAIARALITDPKILLADEPTSDLDPATADSIMRLFEDVHTEGAAVVVVTHERQIPACAGLRFLMERGRLVSFTKR